MEICSSKIYQKGEDGLPFSKGEQMTTLFQEIYEELVWFIGREASYTTIFSYDNDYEYYHEGCVQILHREIKHIGEVIDIHLAKDGYTKGSTIEIKQLKDYTVENRKVCGYLLHKTLSIHLRDGSMVILAAENIDLSPQQTDIELSEEYVRYLFHLPADGDL